MLLSSRKMCTDKGKDEEEKDDCNINQPNQSVSSKHQNEQDKEFLLWSKQHISNSDVDKSKSSNNTFELLNDEAAAVATLTSLSNGADMLPSHENTEKDNSTDEIVIRKRNRERQRRSDLNSQFQTLKSMVKKFEKEDTFSSDISSSSSTSNEGDSSNLKPKNKKRRIHIPAGNIGNRIDLIARTISILERLFETNKSLRNKTKAIKKTLRQAGKNIHKDKTNPNISIDSEIDYQDTTATVEHGGPDASGGEPMNKNYIGNDAAVNQSMNEELMNATIGIMMPHLHANHHRSSVGETITNHDVSTRKVSNENQVS